MNILTKALSICALTLIAIPVSASTVTITFDDTDGSTSGGNPKTYTSQGYEFVPVNINGDGKCDDGKCTKESTQTSLPTLTRTDEGAFDLDKFYFSLIGEGTRPDNYLSVSSFTGNATDGYVQKGSSVIFALNDILADYTAASVSFAKAATGAACDNPTDDPEDIICKNYGYSVDLSGNADFEDITKISWSSFGTAQALIDSVQLTAAVPLPASGLLVLGGLGGLAAVGRRRRKASTQS